MTKDVIVRVRGVQFIPDTPDEEEPIEIVTPGVYEYADGVHKIVYEETFEGFENEPTVNTVTIADDSIIVQKVGAITVDMVFEPGKDLWLIIRLRSGPWIWEFQRRISMW